MRRVVLDTNVLVSALWTPLGNPSTIVSLALSDKITPCFDYRILAEYHWQKLNAVDYPLW
jgi:putative PIN family toxin of toxin-antitoxin system